MVGLPFLIYGLIFLRLMLSDRVVASGRGLAGQAVQGMGVFGWALVLLALAYLFLVQATVVADFADFFKILMPRTPVQVFSGILIFLTTIVLLSGIEVLGRVSLILLPVIIILIFIGVLGNLNEFDWQAFYPLMNNGMQPVLKASFMQMSYASELFALGFLGAYLGYSGRKIRRALYGSLLLIIILFVLISVVLIGVLGESYTVRSNFKLFSLFQHGTGYFLTGYESFFIPMWVTVFFVKVALLQGAIGIALAEITPFKANVYYLIAGMAVLIVSFYLYDNRLSLLEFYSVTYPPVALAFTLLFLVLVRLFPGRNN